MFVYFFKNAIWYQILVVKSIFWFFDISFENFCSTPAFLCVVYLLKLFNRVAYPLAWAKILLIFFTNQWQLHHSKNHSQKIHFSIHCRISEIINTSIYSLSWTFWTLLLIFQNATLNMIFALHTDRVITIRAYSSFSRSFQSFNIK